VKRLLSLLITIAVLGVGIILSTVLYLMAKSEFEQQLEDQANNVHHQVQQRFRIFDELLANDEKEIQEHARRTLLRLSDIVLKKDFNSKDWTSSRLQQLSKAHHVDAIYIIDPSTTVVATNFTPDLNFKLGTISDTFNNYLKGLYGSGRLEVDRINVSSKTGLIKIYAYYAPVGSDYILEVSYDVKNYLSRNRSSRYVDFMFGEFFTEMTKTNPLLEKVDIYLVNNYAAFPFLNSTEAIDNKDLPEIPERGVKTIEQNRNIIHHYSRADFNRSNLHSAEYLAIRSTFNLAPMNYLMNKFLGISLIVVVLVLGLAFFLVAFLFDRWILRRIFRIITALERSADGDYRDQLQSDRMDELGLISQHINSMNSRISARDEQLQEARLNLEQRVEARTLDLQQEVEARKKAEEQLILLAETDPLTGVLNRRAFAERAGIEIERAQRYKRPLAVIILDLDRFKQINDQYGHQCGDRVLIEFANLIKPCLRAVDSLSRHGGEEFLILLPETDELEAFQLAERLRKKAEECEMFSGKESFKVTGSFGVATWKNEEKDIQATIHRADQALYKAKHSGRNQVVTYCPENCSQTIKK